MTESQFLRALGWIIAVNLAALALHVDRVPPWCSVVAVSCALWRLACARWRVPLPGRWIRSALGVTLLVVVAAQFRSLSGLAAGSALLICMSAMKLLETRARRDHFILLGTALFVMLAACLDRPTLSRAPLYLLHAYLSCVAMVVVAAPQVELRARAALALVGRAFAYALPIAIVCALLFPRLQGQLWALPSSATAATGLADEMSPGAISELSESDDPAFRVRFAGPTPPPAMRYWRGPVLHEFDGYTWRRASTLYKSQRLEYLGEAYRYRISMEPHQRHWYFALDIVTGVPPGLDSVRFTFDYELRSFQPVSHPVSYAATSHVETRSRDEISAYAARIDTLLPPGRNPRSVRLARSMRAAAGSDDAFISAVLHKFAMEDFEYTLTPPKLDLDSIDDFLFNTRRGFCGHFASAFVTLMRAAGLPARVVTGYQGGEWNPIGGYFTVRQSDAHAWAEVWRPGRGWVRFDPTAAVAPERLSRGAFDSLGAFASDTEQDLAQLSVLRRMRLSWDALNTWWQSRFVELDLSTQFDLLRSLGIRDPTLRLLGWLFAGGIVLWLAWLAVRLGVLRPRPGRDALARAYRRLCRHLARAGLPRDLNEGPVAYASRLNTQRPALAGTTELLLRYAELRYGSGGTGEHVRDFCRDVKRRARSA